MTNKDCLDRAMLFAEAEARKADNPQLAGMGLQLVANARDYLAALDELREAVKDYEETQADDAFARMLAALRKVEAQR